MLRFVLLSYLYYIWNWLVRGWPGTGIHKGEWGHHSEQASSLKLPTPNQSFPKISDKRSNIFDVIAILDTN